LRLFVLRGLGHMGSVLCGGITKLRGYLGVLTRLGVFMSLKTENFPKSISGKSELNESGKSELRESKNGLKSV
jgi:hypothetical protein